MLKIATWNISEGVSETCDLSNDSGKGNSYKETKLLKSITETIINNNLEVVCFQEFPVEVEGQELLKEKIAKNTDLKYYTMLATYPSFLFSGGNVGVAIFSKYPIIKEEKTYFNNPKITKISKSGALYTSFDKGIIYIQIEKEDSLYNIVTGHAIAFYPFDKKEIEYPESYQPLSKLICDLAKTNEKLIVTGDFNTEDLFSLIPNVKAYVKDILDGPTTPDYYEHRGPIKVDWILINELVSKINIETKETLSDHYLCVAEIE